MEIQPFDATLGASITDVKLDLNLNKATFKKIEEALYKYGVIVFPKQYLSDDEHIAFSRRFGPLEPLGYQNHSANVSYKEIGMISNVKPDGTLWPRQSEEGLFLKGNTGWHTDSSFKQYPAKASILAAHKVPTQGGGTEFADMRAAYDALKPSMRNWLEGKLAVHSFIYSQGLIGGLPVLTKEEAVALVPVKHPIVSIHPKTGRKSLYIGRHASHIEGINEQEGREVLQKLCEDSCQSPRVFTHCWDAGDIVMWDNRCVLHRGQTWPEDQARVMARTTVSQDDFKEIEGN